MPGLFTKRRNLIVLAAVVVFLLHCGIYLRFTVDDSFISYRFARNWAHGLGLVYNPGDRVEGYTSFAWVALLALAHRLGIDIEPASKALGIASGVLCIVGVAAISARLLNGRPTHLVAPFVLALSPLYAAWACSGMDTALFSAVVVWAAYALILDESGRHSIPLSAPCLGVAALIRPEGLLFGAAALLSILTSRAKAARSLAWAKWTTMFAVVVLPILVWRFSYYGGLFPNTFYAKTGRGAERLVSGAWCVANFAEYQGLAFVALCVVGILSSIPSTLSIPSNPSNLSIPSILSLSKDGRESAAWRYTRLAIPAFFAYVIWAGGDFLHIRFFVHVMGLLAVCAAVGFDRVAAGWGLRSKPILAYCALALAWVCLAGIQDYRALRARDQFGAAYVVSNSRNIHSANIPLGKWLCGHAPTGSTAAAWDIGGLGYYSELNIVDLYGLTDSTLARLIHARASDEQKAAYVQSRRPEFIVAYSAPTKPDIGWLGASGDWVRRNYRFHSYWRGGPDGYGLALLVRRDIPQFHPFRNVCRAPTASRWSMSWARR